MKTPKNIINKYVQKKHIFKSEKDFQDYLRKENKAPDFVVVDNILYTMENYDQQGQELIYINARNKLNLYVYTSDRYKNKYIDAIIETMKAIFWRDDVIIAD